MKTTTADLIARASDTLRSRAKSAARTAAEDLREFLAGEIERIAEREAEGLFDHVRRSLRRRLKAASVPADVRGILSHTPPDEVPEIPLRADTEVFLTRGFAYQRPTAARLGYAKGTIGERRVRITLSSHDRAIVYWRNGYDREGDEMWPEALSQGALDADGSDRD